MNPLDEALRNAAPPRAGQAIRGFVERSGAGDDFASIVESVGYDASQGAVFALDPRTTEPEKPQARQNDLGAGDALAASPPLFPYAALLPLADATQSAEPPPGAQGDAASAYERSAIIVGAADGTEAPTAPIAEAASPGASLEARDAGDAPTEIAMSGREAARPDLAKSAAPSRRFPAIQRDAGSIAPSSLQQRAAPKQILVETEAPSRWSAIDTASSARPGAGGPVEDADASEPLRIHVTEIGAHLPLAIARALTNDAATAPEQTRPTAEPPSHPPYRPEALKILRFDIEPAALGAISVRMKITQSRVEISMEAQTKAASTILMDARDALSAAIGDKGLVLESFDVRAPPLASHAATTPDSPNDNAGNFERSFAHDDRPGHRERQGEHPRATHLRDDAPSSFVPVGVIL